MSIQIVNELGKLGDKELFYRVLVQDVRKQKSQPYLRANEQTLLDFRSILVKDGCNFGIISHINTIPFFLEMASRINKYRKYRPSPMRIKVTAYDFNRYRICNNNLIIEGADYIKMRLSLTIDCKSIQSTLRTPFFGERFANSKIRTEIARIKEEDDKIIKIARGMMKIIMAIKDNIFDNLNHNCYDIY